MAGQINKVDIPIGLGQIYYGNVRVGSPKSSVVIHAAVTNVVSKAGNMLEQVKVTPVGSELTLTANIQDLKLDQLRVALGISANKGTGGTLRKSEEINFVSGTIALSETPVADSVKVHKLDYSEDYVSGTDYSISGQNIVRDISGSIASGEVVVVDYDFVDSSATTIKWGTDKVAIEKELKFVHELSNGKLVQFTFHKAVVDGPLDLTFSEDAENAYPIVFRVLADPTKPEKERLMTIIQEA